LFQLKKTDVFVFDCNQIFYFDNDDDDDSYYFNNNNNNFNYIDKDNDDDEKYVNFLNTTNNLNLNSNLNTDVTHKNEFLTVLELSFLLFLSKNLICNNINYKILLLIEKYFFGKKLTFHKGDIYEANSVKVLIKILNKNTNLNENNNYFDIYEKLFSEVPSFDTITNLYYIFFQNNNDKSNKISAQTSFISTLNLNSINFNIKSIQLFTQIFANKLNFKTFCMT
jgi:hypothetical protein